jgi:tRNA dimethylallyltransferase
MKDSSLKINNVRIIVILGPTASGKSDLAVRIAKEINGEVISADSRQVYRGLNIGTGKITNEEMRGVKHYLLDVADSQDRFTVTQFRKLAAEAVKEIIKHNKVPILCGGTGFYIDSFINNTNLPEVGADEELRASLKKKNVDELFQLLKSLNINRAETMNDSDRKNARRLIRAIEIESGEKTHETTTQLEFIFEPVFIGINPPKEILHQRIHDRLIKRLNEGMLNEAIDLHNRGLSFERMEELGLEYRYMARHLQNKLTLEQMIAELEMEIKHYAKRQMTWFKRNKAISWYENADEVGPFGGPTFLRTDLE